MTETLTSGSYTGPTRSGPVILRLAQGPATLKLLGAPGVTLLPTDTPINGGFF